MNEYGSLPDGGYVLLFCAGLAVAALLGAASGVRLGRTLRKIEAATEDRPEVGAAIRDHVGGTPGRVLRRLVVRAWWNRVRPSRCERLAGCANALGAAIVGGPLGADLRRQWSADLGNGRRQGRIPAELLLEALGNLIGSFKILASERVLEFLRRRYATPWRVAAGLLDFAARSKPTAVVLLGLPAMGGVTLAGYLIGGTELAYALLGASFYAAPAAAVRWQAGRFLAVRTRLATQRSGPGRR
ncbi:hypothetical protein AGRA3207_004495 [Actinomadura graeca]|uniref:Type II secretion system protein GspF domain-containing protein n=1 Tax=Actinomadura graeca TaxID=2750812 RepID=A0ABX8QXC6_9ACTN|nr:hypothetical protein [Actinomadura graeca]QXJ23353.1 hypothetical protein AGRA3207_004495 [Actinomadura graeca]